MGTGYSKASSSTKGDSYKRINAQGNLGTTYAVYNGDNLVKIVGTKVDKGGAVLSNKNDVINFVKKQVNVDLSKAIDENRFSSRSRTYLDIDSRKLSINEFNTIRKLLQYDKGLRFVDNGAYNYAIYYQKKKK